jgi:glucosamine--fructose-6-phosphate aminotransferase (isomerizing)
MEDGMGYPGQHTEREILSQPDAWAATLAAVQEQADPVLDLYRRGAYDAVVFTGCGSTYYLALAAAETLQDLIGIPARGLPASEVWLRTHTAAPAGRRTLLVAVSRSGETTETLRACQMFRARALGDVLTLSCYPGRPLTTLGTVNLLFPAGQEESVAQTRAFTCLYLAAVAVAASWAGRDDVLAELARLPEAGRRLLDGYRSLADSLGSDPALDRFYFLGSGPRYGLACELSLKMKEMSLSHSEPFHAMEFRHGPISMVTPSTLTVALLSVSSRPQEAAVLEDVRARGARVLAMAESDADVTFAAHMGEVSTNVLYLPLGQMLAFARARSRGLDPDRPHNLTAVVRLE